MAVERNIYKPIPGSRQLFFDSGGRYWGEEIACVSNRDSLVVLRISYVSGVSDKTFFLLRRV